MLTRSAIAFLDERYQMAESTIQIVFMEIGIFIGIVTFIGSIIACQKLNGKYRNVSIKGQAFWNIFLVVVAVILMVLSGLSSYYEESVREVIEPVMDVDNLGFVSSSWCPASTAPSSCCPSEAPTCPSSSPC